MPKIWSVYWLYNDDCEDHSKDGYIGITANLPKRISGHRRSKRFPAFEFKLIATGTHVECLSIERQLRPSSNLAWNKSKGGKPTIDFTKRVRSNMSIAKLLAKIGNHDRLIPEHLRSAVAEYRKNKRRRGNGCDETPEHREKISKALTGHVRTAESRAKQGASMRGVPKTPEQKAKMAEARRQWWMKMDAKKRAAYSATMSEAKRASV